VYFEVREKASEAITKVKWTDPPSLFLKKYEHPPP